MKITLKEFLECVVRLQMECSGLNRKSAEDKVNLFSDPLIGEFDIAHQTAVAVFCTQKGDLLDIAILREYLNEAYSGNDLGVSFI